jgi:hypothetical protein
MSHYVKLLTAARDNPGLLQPLFQGPCRVLDPVIQILAIEGQDQVMAVGDPGPLHASRHGPRITDDAVNEQGNPVSSIGPVADHGWVGLVAGAAIVIGFGNCQDRAVVV